MHDTAFRIGCLVIDIYATVKEPRILELGSANGGSSLRSYCLPPAHYVGIDFDAGSDTDIAGLDCKPLPVDDNTFDLIIASSIFDRDLAFWVPFLDTCRKAAPGGYVYINIPANGARHCNSQTYWRFYPDSALALVRWARSQGEQMTLIESFTTCGETEISNEFVAIFRKGGIHREPAKVFVHDHVPSCNVRTWKSATILRPQDLREDIALLPQIKDELKYAGDKLEQLNGTIADLNQHYQREREDLHHRLALAESTLRQREEEIAQLNAAPVAREQREQDVESLRARLSDADRWVYRLAGDRRAAENDTARATRQLAEVQRELVGARARLRAGSSIQAEVERWRKTAGQYEGELAEATQTLAQVSKALDEAHDSLERRFEEIAILTSMSHVPAEPVVREEILAATQSKLDERFRELAKLSDFLQDQEISVKIAQDDVQWLRDVHIALFSCPSWWSYMSKSWQERKRRARLKRKGLFDGGAYLARYPDVDREGTSPLRHYIRHGMAEGRLR